MNFIGPNAVLYGVRAQNKCTCTLVTILEMPSDSATKHVLKKKRRQRDKRYLVLFVSSCVHVLLRHPDNISTITDQEAHFATLVDFRSFVCFELLVNKRHLPRCSVSSQTDSFSVENPQLMGLQAIACFCVLPAF